ncbi:hypothetical protein [Iamia sp. SCSIO 61187]|uniref:hypothetical protein n=1 Tax=Iamia sp. SCSIO 61187 TaxID=2722752 RepID=UPI001C627FA4|nr:hypothetical protein [Iamia sp. SCSIO 61187]
MDGREGRLVIPAPPLWTVAVVGAAVLVVHLIWPAGPTGDATYLGALIGASVLAWLMVAGGGPGDRRAWAMVAVGLSLSATADLVWYVDYWLTGVEPDISLADPLWLVSYVALGIGLMRLTPKRDGARGVDVDAIIDSLVPAVLVLVALWELAIADLISDEASSPLARTVWATYPILDVVVLTLAVRLAIHHHRTRSRALTLFGLGVAAWLAADVGYLLATAEGLFRWLDAGWMVASVLLAAAIVAHRRDGGPALGEDVAGAHRGRMWLVMVPLLVPPVIEVRGFLDGTDANPVALGAATVALVVLASIRGHRLLRAAERARATLQVGEAHFRALPPTPPTPSWCSTPRGASSSRRATSSA